MESNAEKLDLEVILEFKQGVGTYRLKERRLEEAAADTQASSGYTGAINKISDSSPWDELGVEMGDLCSLHSRLSR
jgi:hypothetical protein